METQTIVIIALIVVCVLGMVFYVRGNINKRRVKQQEALSIKHGMAKNEEKTSALAYVDREQLTSNISTASNFKYQESPTPQIKSVNSQDWVTSQQAQQAIAVHEQQQEQHKLARQRQGVQGRNAKKNASSRSETSEFRSTLDKHPKAAQSFLNQRTSGKGKQVPSEPTYVEAAPPSSQDLVKDKFQSSKQEVFNMMKTRKPESELPLSIERQNASETQIAQGRKANSPVQRVKVPNPAQTQARMRGMQPGGATATATTRATVANQQNNGATANASQMTLNDYTANPDYVATHQPSAALGNLTFNAANVAPQVAVQGGKENYLHSPSLNQGGFVKGLSDGDFDSLVGKPATTGQPVSNLFKTSNKSIPTAPVRGATQHVGSEQTTMPPNVGVVANVVTSTPQIHENTHVEATAPGADSSTNNTTDQQFDWSSLTPESLAAILAQTNLTQAYRNVSSSVPLNDQFLKSTVIPDGTQQEKLQQANIFAHIETDPVIRQLNGLFQNEAHGYHIFKLEPSRSPYLSKEIIVNLFNNTYLTDGLTFVQDVEHSCYRLQFKNMETRKNVTLLFVFLDKGQFTAENLAREIEYLILYIPKRYFERSQDNILTYLLTRLVSLRGRLSGELTLHGRRVEAAAMYTTSTMRRTVQNILENKK